LRRLSDNTMLVFLSDTHIGGDPGVNIFESAPELAAWFDEMSERDSPIELVLAGDAFDFLRMSDPGAEDNRASVIIRRPEYQALFEAWRRFAGREDCKVIYLPGNHDAEAWWNQDVQATLKVEGLVNEFALSYVAAFDSRLDKVIYCEHGNQFDPTNAIADYSNPRETPLGDHIVTELVRRLSPLGRIGWNIHLGEASYIFPLVALPAWITGRVLYSLLTWLGVIALVWVAALTVLPGLVLLISESGTLPDPGPFWPGTWWREGSSVRDVLVEIGWDLLWLLVLIGLFYVAVQRTIGAVVGFLSVDFPGAEEGTAGEAAALALLESDRPLPMRPDTLACEISVFVVGHSHAPSLAEFRRRDGNVGAVANTGCWLRQLRPVPAHLGGPPVFVPVFVQSHVRVLSRDSGLSIELWQNPRQAARDLTLVERLAILGRGARPTETGGKDLPVRRVDLA
jgi:hypothetical protein